MKLLILCQAQFGYHTDTWYYSKYLKDTHEVLYLGWDYGKPKRKLSGVKSKSVSRMGNKLVRVIRYIVSACKTIREEQPALVFIKYFKFCFILKLLFPSTTFVFDIRTGDVNSSPLKRNLSDKLMKVESFFFSNISIISEGLRDKLNYAKSAYILPLGAEVLSTGRKEFNHLHLLYVGTLSGRNIEQTIIGLSEYCKEVGYEQIKYTIVGEGWSNELEQLQRLAASLGLDDVIQFTGYVHHEDIGQYFDAANVGVAFVPKTDFYDHQPATKTYEYLLSGMAVIATATTENSKVIDEHNGVLIESTSDGFYEGLRRLCRKLNQGECVVDGSSYQKFSWGRVAFDLEGYLEGLI